LAALPQRRTSPNHVFPGRKPDLHKLAAAVEDVRDGLSVVSDYAQAQLAPLDGRHASLRDQFAAHVRELKQRMDVTDEILDLRHNAVCERLKGLEMLAAMVEEQSRVGQERDETHRQRMADLWYRMDALHEYADGLALELADTKRTMEELQKRLKELDVDGNGERG
jgi:chromosome segregation ATPase